MWICNGNNTKQLYIRPYGFLVSYLIGMGEMGGQLECWGMGSSGLPSQIRGGNHSSGGMGLFSGVMGLLSGRIGMSSRGMGISSGGMGISSEGKGISSGKMEITSGGMGMSSEGMVMSSGSGSRFFFFCFFFFSLSPFFFSGWQKHPLLSCKNNFALFYKFFGFSHKNPCPFS